MDFSELDVQKLQNEALLEKDRYRYKVWVERGGWEKESYREKAGEREAKGEKPTQGEETNRKKRWEAKPAPQGDLPDKS